MDDGKIRATDPFPAECEVRGCTRRPGEWFASGGLTAQLCSEHELELRAGEPFVREGDELLAGRDCTGEVLGVTVTRTASQHSAVIRLGRRGVVHQEILLDSSRQLERALEALLSRGHGPSTPRRSPPR